MIGKQSGQWDLEAWGIKYKQGMLDTMNKSLNWKRFDTLLHKVFRVSKEGRPSYPPVVLFKAFLPQHWYGLSDPELEESISDIRLQVACGGGSSQRLDSQGRGHARQCTRFTRLRAIALWRRAGRIRGQGLRQPGKPGDSPEARHDGWHPEEGSAQSSIEPVGTAMEPLLERLAFRRGARLRHLEAHLWIPSLPLRRVGAHLQSSALGVNRV